MKTGQAWKTILCGIIICTLAGCQKAGQEHVTASLQTPGHISKELASYLTVDADVVADQPDELHSYTAVCHMPDGSGLKEIFMPDETEVIIEDMPDWKRSVCKTKDGTKRASTAAGIAYMDNRYVEYYALLSTGDVAHMYPEDFSEIKTVEKLSFAGRQEAKEAVEEMAERVDIRLAEEPFVFEGIDEEGFQALYKKELERNGEEAVEGYLPDFEVKQGMECYYMLWKVLTPHGEIFRNGNIHIGGGVGIDGAYVMAIYTPGGLTCFRTNARFAIEEENAAGQIMEAGDALEQIKKVYDNVILTEKDRILITEISLDYVPVLRDIQKGIYDIVPAWCMYGSVGGNSVFFTMVDAQTGDIL